MLTFSLDKIALKPHSKVLDVGCGEGRHIFGSLHEYVDVHCIGLDQDIPSLNKCKEGFEFFKELNSGSTVFMQGSVYSLPFDDNTFDLVICSEVLEHLDDYHAAIDEIYRVLKPEGKFLPSVPSYWPEKICWSLSSGYQNMPGGHVRIFKKRQVINEISDHGFKYDYSERFHGLHSAYWWLRCLFWSTQDSNYFVSIYKKFLEYHILQSPAWLNHFEKILNPIFGKSIAFYFEKKMKKFPNTSHIDPSSLDGLNHLGKFLDDVQFLSGAIPSNQDGSHDPWDHLEAVMGLSTLGLKNQALNGLHWMVANQNEDGSWYNLYQDEKPLELNKQTNYASYIAVAVWHFYLLNNDVNFLQDFWEPVKKGILFTLSLQHRNGAIAWNIDKSKKIDEDYLLTGCSSIAKSLECAIAICQVLEHKSFELKWRDAHLKLIVALENPAEIFDLKKDRSRFSMDWYYPILGGIDSKERITSLVEMIKTSFWIKGLGIKCVADEPWVTVAETSECSIAFKKIGEDKIALELLLNAIAIVDGQGIPYMGWQFDENIYWPEETPSWTAAACILAADANHQLTPSANLFIKQQFKS